MADDGFQTGIGADNDAALMAQFDVPAGGSETPAGPSAPAAESGSPASPETATKEAAPTEASKPAEAAPAKGVQPKAAPTGPRPAIPPKKEAAPAPVAKVEEKKEEPKPPVAAAPVAPAMPAAPAAAAPTPDQKVDLTAIEKQLTDGMTNHFASLLTKQDIELLATEPEKVLPAFVAKAGMSLYYATTHAVAQALPGMIQNAMNATKAQTDATQGFFGKFPALNKPELQETIGKVAQAYRQMNPNVSLQQAIEDIGRMASGLLNLPIGPAPSPSPAPAPVPKPPVPAPHRPALPGAAASASPGQGANEWATMLNELEGV